MSDADDPSPQLKTVADKRPVTVVGSGFSGLAAAFYLDRAGFSVEVIEEREREGGLISTRRLPQGLVETAANGLLNSRLVEDLFNTIGLELLPTKSQAKRRFIFRRFKGQTRGRPRRWPLGPFASLRFLFFLIRFLLAQICATLARRSIRTGARTVTSTSNGFRGRGSLASTSMGQWLTCNGLAPRSGETVRNWARRVMGQDAADYTVEAFLQGIYAGDPGRMSAALVFGRFFESQNLARSDAQHADAQNSVVQNSDVQDWKLDSSPAVLRRNQRKKMLRGTVSAPEGMGQLVAQMKKHLESRGVRFQFGKRIELNSGEPDHPVVVATSAHQAAQIIEQLSPVRAKFLREIQVVPVVTVTVFFRDTDPKSEGFGCLFPPVEERRALGVLKNDFIFDGRVQAGHSETWIFGGAQGGSKVFELSDQEILNQIIEERADCFGVQGEIVNHAITRWEHAIPHYTLELERALPHLRGFESNVILIGNYLGQIGLGKILELASRLPSEVDAKGRWA